MAYSIAHKNQSPDGSSSSVSSFTLSITSTGAGNALIASVQYYTGASAVAVTAKDSGNTSLTAVDSVFSSADLFQFADFFEVGIASGLTSIVFSFASSVSYVRAMMLEVSGIATSSALDHHAMQAQSAIGTGANAVTSGATATLSTSGDFVYGCSCETNANGTSFTAGTNFTAENNTNTSSYICAQADEVYYPYNSTTGIAATFTGGTSNSDYITGVMAFKPAPTTYRGVRFLPTLPFGGMVAGGGAFRAARAIERNTILTRRSLLWMPDRRIVRI